MEKRQSLKTKSTRLPYRPPADRVQKLGLIGNMGYISANPDTFIYQYNRQLAWRRSGGGGGGRR